MLTGTTRVRRQGDGYGFSTNLEGPIAKIIPPQFRAFFGAETTLTANGLFRDAGGLLLDSLDLKSGGTYRRCRRRNRDGWVSEAPQAGCRNR